MEKIQFKRANTTAGLPTLDTGEIGIVQSRAPKDNYIVIGTDYGNKSITAYPYYSGSTDGVVYDVTIQDSDVGTEKNLVVKKVTLNGSKTETPISFTISGTIEKAKQLVDNNGNGYSVGSDTSNTCQPIYFAGGKPSAIKQTRGSNNTPIWMDTGVIKPISGKIGHTNRPVYIDSNGAIQPITFSTGKNKIPYFSGGQIFSYSSDIGSSTRPMYYSATDGMKPVDNFDDGGNYTGKRKFSALSGPLNITTSGIAQSDLNISTHGIYCILGNLGSNDSYLTFIIAITTGNYGNSCLCRNSGIGLYYSLFVNATNNKIYCYDSDGNPVALRRVYVYKIGEI